MKGKRVRLRPENEADAAAQQMLPFGPPPLLEGEDAAAYDDLLVRISTVVKPANIIEDIWVRDVVDLTWEVFRLRRVKAALLTANAHIGLEVLLRPLVEDGIGELVEKWARGDRRAIQQVKTILSSAKLTMDAVFAETVSVHIEQLERMERMLAQLEARRNAILREIDRHRDALARPLRPTLNELLIVDETNQGKDAT